MAALDLGVALYRGRAHRARQRLLHPVHLLQRGHVHRDRDDRLLRAGVGDDRAVRAGVVGDGEAAEGAGAPAGGQEEQQQAVGLEVGRFILKGFIFDAYEALNMAEHVLLAFLGYIRSAPSRDRTVERVYSESFISFGN